MKTLRLVWFIVAALVIAFVANRRSTAQSTNSPDDRGMLGQYEQLVSSLSKRGENDTVAQITSLVSAMHTGKDARDIAMTVQVLDSLRSGRTDEAIRVLEDRLDGALMTFGTRPHDTKYDKLLKAARDYRTKYPHKSGNLEMDAAIARAFASVPQ